MPIDYVSQEEFARLQGRVDTIWDFVVRRAAAEAVYKGIATMNTPLVVAVEDLQAFYASLPRGMPDSEIMMEIEKKFGPRIVKDVCIPYKLHGGACLLIALDVARNGDGIIHLDCLK